MLYYTEDPKNDHNFDNHPKDIRHPVISNTVIVPSLQGSSSSLSLPNASPQKKDDTEKCDDERVEDSQLPFGHGDETAEDSQLPVASA